MPCDRCPCRAICLGWDVFCEWAAETPRDPVKIAHICARSAMGATLPAREIPPVSTVAEARPTAAEALALTRAVAACPYRSTGPGCGCGAKCSLRRHAAVSHVDCFDCVSRYGPP